MISVQTIQLLVMGGVTGVVVGSGSVFTVLKKKGIDSPEVLSNIEKGIVATEPIIAVAKGIAPLNPAVNILDLIEKYAKTGVKNAEQLYLSSQLPADQRNAKAKDTISAVLKASNVEVTPEIEKIIDGAIEASVLDLGHNKTDAEKEAAKQALQAQLAQITAENTQLKTTINTITTAATAVNTTQPVQPIQTSTQQTA
jgi:hypothetical protein